MGDSSATVRGSAGESQPRSLGAYLFCNILGMLFWMEPGGLGTVLMGSKGTNSETVLGHRSLPWRLKRGVHVPEHLWHLLMEHSKGT